jgi:hypothetical protein
MERTPTTVGPQLDAGRNSEGPNSQSVGRCMHCTRTGVRGCIGGARCHRHEAEGLIHRVWDDFDRGAGRVSVDDV